MVIIARIRITSPFLGALQSDNQGVRRFQKKKGKIVVNSSHWMEQFAAARRIVGLDVDVETILLPESYDSPTLQLYRRTYSGTNVEMFESIRNGTHLTFELATREDLPKCPTLEQVKVLLEAIGKYLGLSQWGSKFKFGRFEVLDCYDKYKSVSAEADMELRKPDNS